MSHRHSRRTGGRLYSHNGMRTRERLQFAYLYNLSRSEYSRLSKFIYKDSSPTVILQLVLEHTSTSINKNKTLRRAVSHQNVVLTKILIQYNADVDCYGGYCIRTVCYGRPSENSFTIVKLLILAGADVNRNPQGCASAIQSALWYSPLKTVSLLIENGAVLPHNWPTYIPRNTIDRVEKEKLIQECFK